MRVIFSLLRVGVMRLRVSRGKVVSLIHVPVQTSRQLTVRAVSGRVVTNTLYGASVADACYILLFRHHQRFGNYYSLLLILLLLVAWHSGNVLRLISEVTLQRARLILRWVTVWGQVNHLGTKPANQVDSAFCLPWDGKMSISFLAE